MQSMKFGEWWNKYFTDAEFDKNNSNHRAMKEAYEQGHFDGWEGCRNKDEIDELCQYEWFPEYEVEDE